MSDNEIPEWFLSFKEQTKTTEPDPDWKPSWGGVRGRRPWSTRPPTLLPEHDGTRVCPASHGETKSRGRCRRCYSLWRRANRTTEQLEFDRAKDRDRWKKKPRKPRNQANDE
jgi:hypothetical protein